MSCQVELIPITEGNRVTVKEEEKLIIGRGSSLGCTDKKISRQHAELVLKKDATLWIKPTHTNPVFYRSADGKKSQLTKDVQQELKEGDQIGLLPTSFFFRVNFSKDANATGATASSKDEPQTNDSDAKSRKLPTWMSSSNGHSSTKRALSEEKKDDIDKKEPASTSDAKTVDKPSAPKTFDSVSDDSHDSTPAKKVKKNDKPRPACSYGATCYRKNPGHRAEQSHPGDSDYEDEKESKDSVKKVADDDNDKPTCPYGKTCYRQNPQHKRDYQH